MNKSLTTFIFSALVVFLMSACGGGYTSKHTAVVDLADQKKTDKLNEAIMLSAVSQHGGIEKAYLIGPEDLLEIEAYNVEELKKTVRVSSKGEIALPLVGILKVEGLTTSQTEKLIAKKLEKYVEETVVTVYVKEYKSHRISVIGAVKNPQIFTVTGQRYLIDMLMMAGGVSNDAGNICYIIRPSQKAGNNPGAQTIVIDLEELLLKGNLSLNIPVFAGDLINVPRGGIFFVDGEVRSPGVYTMKGRTSLIQALSIAKGATPDAALGDVRIFRDNGIGEREVIYTDYDDIRDGSKPDIVIADNDIIIVPKSGIKSFFNGFVRTIRGAVTFGSASVGF